MNNTSVAILLVLNRGARSGYDVKAFVDSSARHFWAASYGRIYPELKKLADQGLIEGTDEAQGARPKTVYALTDAGREVLQDWYEQEPTVYEVRDEPLLKVFFGEAFDPELVSGHIETRRRISEKALAELRAVEPMAKERAESEGDPFPHETLLCGIRQHESAIAWCESAERHLKSSKSKKSKEGSR